MKTSSARFFLLLACLCVFASVTVAQEKPQALKFDEFDDVVENRFYSDRNEITFTERLERFSKRLEKERAVTAYVIYYQARITYESLGWNFLTYVNGVKNEIKYNDRIKIKDVVIADGGYRENNSVELWIVPENAEPPAPTPTLDKSETYICRNINVYGDIPLSKTDTINFSVPAYNLEGISDYTLTWKVSAGEIVSGQRTNGIEVKLNNSVAKRVTAFLEVGGLPYPCQKVFSATGEINVKRIYLIDSFGAESNGSIKARLDSFSISLNNNPTAKGYIIVYGNRGVGNRDVERRVKMINDFLFFRNYDVSRVTILRGGFRESISTDLWLSFDDTQKPIPTPTVDEKFIVIPKPARKSRPRKK